jgi:hypothetical protein
MVHRLLGWSRHVVTVAVIALVVASLVFFRGRQTVTKP